eukprot:snap_masked-scaffold_1-processed-gene-16.47-mRNA-1 protein AED:0.96 eAED:1.00 QI:0/0/0/0.33/1/1/3/0/257
MKNHDNRAVARLAQLEWHFILHATANFKPKQAVEILCQINKAEDFKRNINHYRFGHLNNNILKKNKVSCGDQKFCIGCSAAKLSKRKKKNAVDPETTTSLVARRKFEKLHVDTVGAFPKSLRGYMYAVTVVDSFTNYIMLILTKKKQDISTFLIQLIKKLERRYELKVKCLFSDNGSEFMNLHKYASIHGITLETSSNYMPSENGKVERYNRSIFHNTKAMLHQANLNMSFWALAALYSTLILNYTIRLREKTHTNL